MHQLRIVPSGMLDSFCGLEGLIDEALFECDIQLVVDLRDLLWFVEFLDMIVKLKELHHVSFFKEFFIIFHDRLNMIFHLLQLFGGQGWLHLLNEPLLHHHPVINCMHFVLKTLLFRLQTGNCVIDVLESFEFVF